MRTGNPRTMVFLKRLGKTEDDECKVCGKVRITAHYVFRVCRETENQRKVMWQKLKEGEKDKDRN